MVARGRGLQLRVSWLGVLIFRGSTFKDSLSVNCQSRSQGGSLGSEEPPPPPPQSENGPPKGPLECTKRSTRLHEKVHYYSLHDK